MALDFPVVQFVPATQSPVRREAVSAFVSSLYDADTRSHLRAAGLRDAKGSAFPSTVGFDGIAPTATIRSLPQVSDQQITDSRRVWSAAQRRNRTLIVVDVSGSMLEQGGDKIRSAAAAAKDAVGYLPDDAELGLWAFSTNLTGAAPWRKLVSVGPLGSPADQQARRQTLRSQASQLPRLAQSRGNTGLYRTTWDAFQTVRNGYDPRRYNSVVVVTDGTDIQGLDYATGGTALEVGASLLPFSWNESWARLNIAVQVSRWQSIATPSRFALSFTPLIGPELELLFLSGPALQTMFGVRAGYQASVRDAVGFEECGPDESLGDARNCSQFVLQTYLAGAVIERLRLQLVGEFFPTIQTSRFASRVALQLSFGLQFF